MYIVIFISFLAILLTYLDSRYSFNGGMKWGFILVTLLAVIHYDYGNDYRPYLSVFNEVCSYTSLSNVIYSDLYRDKGWLIVNYLFKYLGGFFGLVAVISIFEGVAYYTTIKKNLPRHLWVFGIFIYLISTSFYLLNFSMLRQGFVVALFLMVWPMIEKRKWWIVAPLLYLSSFIHGSALILIPFAFWGYVPVRNGKSMALIFSIVLGAMYFSSQFLTAIPQLVFEATDAFENYEDIYADSSVTTRFGIGFLVYLIPTIISILYLGNSKASDEMKRLVLLSCIGSFFTPLATIILMVGRVGMYFGVYRVIALPVSYSAINNKVMRFGLIALYVFILLYDYHIFFRSEVFGPYYSSFNTIFSQL